MADFWKKNKGFIIGTIATCLIVIGGIFLLGGNSDPKKEKMIDHSVLISAYSHATSGFLNSTYLPASSSASVTLVEFGDYVCPACAAYEPYVKKILTDLPGQINFTFRNYPLSYHTNAQVASFAVEAAGIQGKYWEMHEKVFTTKDIWSNLEDPIPTFINYATELGLDVEKFTIDINSQTVKDIITRDKKDGITVGLTETPTFYLNGEKVVLTGKLSDLEDQIKLKLNK